MALTASKAEFDWFMDIAKAYGLTYEGVRMIARVEMGKSLEECSFQELQQFAARITGVDRATKNKR